MVKVFHFADCDSVVSSIANNFVFDLLPSLHAALDKHLRARGKSMVTQSEQFLLIRRETTAQPTKSICRTHNDWKPDVLNYVFGLLDGCSRCRLCAFLADGLHATSEEFAVFSGDDSFNRCSKDFDSKGFEFILQLNSNL